MAIRISGGLLEKFCIDVGCADSPTPAPNNTRTPGHPDDNFDVSSRLIELEELDITKQVWKDLYGRTGIKKGYNGLFLEKTITNAYATLAATKTEADFNAASQQFQTILTRAQNEAKHSFEETYYASADVALLSDAFVDNAAELLLKRLKEPIREVKETFNPAALLKNQPVLLIPSGALTGYNDSALLKASLDEYVKNGGTLIVLSQKHGYDYASVPTPDGSPITGYGWEEDQNCFTDSVAIETWHQIFSGQSRSTPTLNVDGYFTGYPANSTVLLRRTANGQPAMLMYEHGQGRVILTSMYSDWAYGHGQASQEEIALVRDILAWAKKPAVLLEAKPGTTITAPVTLTNITATDAASVRLQIWNPDRSTLLAEQSPALTVPTGQAATTDVAWPVPANASLGIYHIDYILTDAAGNTIQPQAETDSGRFVVSNPPQVGTVNKDIWLSITSPNQEVYFNEPFAYTFHIFNNSDTTRNLTLKTLLPHTGRTHEYSITATPNGETTVSGSDLFIDSRWMFETLRAYLYDENNVQIANYMLSFKGLYPKVNVTSATGKNGYARGEAVGLSVNLKNTQSAATTVKLIVRVIDPANIALYTNTLDVSLGATGESTQPFAFTLPANAQGGSYAVSTEVFDTSGNKIGGDNAMFELPLSQVVTTPQLPASWNTGANSLSFNLSNTGRIAVNSGVVDIALKDPDGAAVATNSQHFALGVGQSSTLNAPLTLPTLKFGTYVLSHTQNDETRNGRPATTSLANSAALDLAFDRTSYRIRETANVSIKLMNTGRFNLDSTVVTIAVPDAGYTNSETVSIPAGQTLALSRAIVLPETLLNGQHGMTVTLTLPGGSTLTRSSSFTMPESSLSYALSPSAFTAGTEINPAIANSGGVDTPAQYRLSLYDAKSALIADKSATETAPAGGALALSLSIPSGAADGSYVLVANYRDMKSGKSEIVQKPVTIAGVKGTLAVQTDKQAYLNTETISAAEHIVNSGTDLQGGNLHLQVSTAAGSRQQKTWTSQYDWQQGVRDGVDTFETPDNVTLLPLADNFNDGILNVDRWTLDVKGRAYSPIETGGYLELFLPSPTGSMETAVYHKGLTFGDFEAITEYRIDSPWNYGGNNHAPNFLVFMPDWSWYMWIDVWGSGPLYGTMDSSGRSTNAGGATLQGKLKIKRVGRNFYSYYWNGTGWNLLLNYDNRPAGPVLFRLLAGGNGGNVLTHFDNFVVTSQTYHLSGSMNVKYDSGRSEVWDKLSYSADTPEGTVIQFRTRTAETEAGLSTSGWSGYISVSGSSIASPKGRWIEIETTMSTTNVNVTPVLRDLTVTQGHNPGDVLWQADVPVNMTQGALADLNSVIGTIGAASKYYLQGTVTSGTGQAVASDEYPFFVAQGNTLLSFTSDKRLYKPGESVTITGQVKNLASVDAANLAIVLKSKASESSEQTLYSNTFTLPAGGSLPFSITGIAGAEGVVSLTGTVTQNSATLAEMADQYEVAAPKVTAIAAIPAVAGDDPFNVILSLANVGKTDATVNVLPSFTSLPESVTIPAGQSKLLQYSRQISADSTDTFTLSGDLVQTISQAVTYGPAVTLSVTPHSIYPEGKIAVPMTVTNSGLIDSRFTVDYQLNLGANSIDLQTRNYFAAKGGNASDTLLYDLTEGSYQIAAISLKPAASASAVFQVRKETKADLALTVGAQSGNILPLTVNVSNLGFNPIEGSVRVSLIAENGTSVWTAAQDASLPQAVVPTPQSLAFSANLQALKPGNYTVKAELANIANQPLLTQISPFTLLGPVFELTQVPAYQTVPAGGSITMIFKVKNSGNQEGRFDLAFKADDLIDATRSEWLKPGEEREVAFQFSTASDLDEKDYTTAYRLTTAGATVKEGGVAYRLAGIKLAVTASLDKANYHVGDTAVLTLTVTQQDAGAALDLSVRANYNGWGEKRDFTLNGSQTLIFSVPLAQITGEKLFYGIYHQSGRSIHLNTIYIHKADDLLTVTTDKQVYNPGETVTATAVGTAVGDLTLSAPGGSSASLAFTGSAVRSFTLPSTMTAGTYTVAYKLVDQAGATIDGSTPFDVAGIQVKVKEALLDKAKYAPTDAMKLALTIESNQDIPASVKTWIVDPASSYAEAGSGDVSLIAAAPVVTTVPAALTVASTGIHKLVYGVYQGDLLLASGAKAFDIGDAVLLALSTDKSDYLETTRSVIVKAELYGLADAGVEFFLDGSSIKADTVSLSGFAGYSFAIAPTVLTPGLHTLKAVLTTGGLASVKETRFTYGSNLPDLSARINTQPPAGGTVTVSVTVANQGKEAAGPSKAALYDGDPSNNGLLLATLDIPAIAAGSSVNISYSWNALGKGGSHTLYAVADSNNSVVEFIEGNNVALTALMLPSLALGLSTDQAEYSASSEIGISVNVANLTGTITYDAATLRLRVIGPDGIPVDLPELPLTSLLPATVKTLTAGWNTGVTAPGAYRITASLYVGAEPVASGSISCAVNRTVAVTGSIVASQAEVHQGETVVMDYSLANAGNVALNGMLRGVLIDPATGLAVASAQLAVTTPVRGEEAGRFSIVADALSVQAYNLVLEYLEPGLNKSIAGATVAVRDGKPPVLAVISPVQGTTYPAAIPLSLTATDNASGVFGVEYRLDGGRWKSLQAVDLVTGRFASIWETTIADNGSHQVEFRGSDREGNLSAPVSTVFTVQRDVTPPLLQVSTLADRASTNNITLNIAGLVMDRESGIGGLRINGTPLSVAADGSFSFAMTLSLGENIVATDAVDLAGNHTIDTRTIILDQTAPMLVVTAPPDNGVTGKSFVAFSGAVDEDAIVRISCGDFAQDAIMNGREFTVSVPLAPGLNTIIATAIDYAGNQSSAKRSVMYDNDRPTLAVTEPDQDLTTNARSFLLKGAVSDQLSAVTVSVTMDGQQYLPPLINGFFEQSLAFRTEKLYQVDVTATDEAGNSVTTQRNIIYDATGPLLTIAPVASPTLLAVQTISGTREDGNPVTVVCSTATAGPVEYPTPTSWQIKLTGLQIGNNEVIASSTDSAGNRSTVTVVITRVVPEVRLSVSAKPKVLWPPNRKLVPVKLKAKVMSSAVDIDSLRISVSDEYGKYNYAHLKNGSIVYLESWRRVDDQDGRVYTVTAVATDADGNKFSGTTKVVVPHEMGHGQEHEEHECDD